MSQRPKRVRVVARRGVVNGVRALLEAGKMRVHHRPSRRPDLPPRVVQLVLQHDAAVIRHLRVGMQRVGVNEVGVRGLRLRDQAPSQPDVPVPPRSGHTVILTQLLPRRIEHPDHPMVVVNREDRIHPLIARIESGDETGARTLGRLGQPVFGVPV